MLHRGLRRQFESDSAQPQLGSAHLLGCHLPRRLRLCAAQCGCSAQGRSLLSPASHGLSPPACPAGCVLTTVAAPLIITVLQECLCAESSLAWAHLTCPPVCCLAGCAEPTVAVLYRDSKEAKHMKGYQVLLSPPSFGVSVLAGIDLVYCGTMRKPLLGAVEVVGSWCPTCLLP